jgi:hypothetical protein
VRRDQREHTAYEEYRFLVSRRLGNALFQLSAYLFVRNILEKPAKLDCRFISPRDLSLLLGTGLFLQNEMVINPLQAQALKNDFLSRVMSTIWRFLEILEFRTAVKVFREKRKFRYLPKADSWLTFQNLDEPRWIFGYFQDASLVETVAPFLLQRLQDSTSLHTPLRGGRTKVVIHRRLGDYLRFPQFGILNEDFYFRGIETLHSDDVVVVSDQTELALRLLKEKGYSKTLSSEATGGALEDFSVLLHSESLIVSNSTFSWWAGFLGRLMYQDKVVIGPKPWHQHANECLLFTNRFTWLPATYRSSIGKSNPDI